MVGQVQLTEHIRGSKGTLFIRTIYDLLVLEL